MKQYFAMFQKEEDRPYSVVFPDLPGCFSAGDTYGGAIDNATEALRRYAERANGDMPEPRSFEELIVDEKVRRSAAKVTFVGIHLHFGKGQSISVDIAMDVIDQAGQD